MNNSMKQFSRSELEKNFDEIDRGTNSFKQQKTATYDRNQTMNYMPILVDVDKHKGKKTKHDLIQAFSASMADCDKNVREELKGAEIVSQAR